MVLSFEGKFDIKLPIGERRVIDHWSLVISEKKEESLVIGHWSLARRKKSHWSLVIGH